MRITSFNKILTNIMRWPFAGESWTTFRWGRKQLTIARLLGIIGLIVIYREVSVHIFKLPKLKSESGKGENLYLQKNDQNENVTILHWTRWFGRKQSPIVLTKESCPYLHMPQTTFSQQNVDSVFKTCRINSDKRNLRFSDAIVFHSRDLINETVLPPRSENQVWGFHQDESPILTYLNLKAFPNVFNWSMTYRRDSDVYNPYGHVVPVPIGPNQTKQSDIRHLAYKRRLALMITSNCKTHSNRHFFVHELQKYMQIDIFGACGTPCSTRAYHGECYEPLSKHYKFFLAFENAFCEDYISEKFFKALQYSMVPVVYGGKGADNYAIIAPKKSYIDSRDFATAKELADYLFYLDKNNDEYLEYLKWKFDHKVIPSQGWCNLCQKVYLQKRKDKQVVREFKWYQNLWKWWNYLGYGANDDVVYETRQEDTRPSYNKIGAAACRQGKNFNASGQQRIKRGYMNGKFRLGNKFAKDAGVEE